MLTPALTDQIASYIRAGGFPHIAAEAAGVPQDAFERWLRRGRQQQAPAKYRAFREAVLQAQAQARLAAETAALGNKPMDWLKSGPGRETAAQAGWSSTPRPRSGAQDESNPFLHPLVLAMLRRMIEALTPHPQARVAAAQVILACEEGMNAEEKEQWRRLWAGPEERPKRSRR